MNTNPAIRNESGYFKPGVSGNPSGRPKDELGILIRSKDKLPSEIYQTVYKIMTESKFDKIKLAACEFFRDTGWGKPVQAHNLLDEEGRVVTWQIINYKDSVDGDIKRAA